jgi:hypothetical protein
MLRKKIFLYLFIISVLGSIFALSGCFKEKVAFQISIQEAMLEPGNANDCWALTVRGDSISYRYYIGYYYTQCYNGFLSGGGGEFFNYSPSQYTRERIKGHYESYRIIDNDISDCTKDEDTIGLHTFINANDYPLLNRSEKESYSFPNRTHRSSISTYANPNLKDTNFYYYEELYFFKTGRFIKKVFLDTGCRAIEIRGNWKFRTPFANVISDADKSQVIYTSEIILDYDLATVVGLPPRGNIYTINITSDLKYLHISQRNKEEDKRFLKVRSHFTREFLNTSQVPINPNLSNNRIKTSELGTQLFLQDNWLNVGYIANLWSNSCRHVSDLYDKVELYDPLDLIYEKEVNLFSAYKVTPKRCVAGSVTNNPNCPRLCGLSLCGTHTALLYDSDDNSQISIHESELNISSDSTTMSITNFANTGNTLEFIMPAYTWQNNYCQNHNGANVIFNGKRILLSSFGHAKYTGGDELLRASFSMDGELYNIRYVLK